MLKRLYSKKSLNSELESPLAWELKFLFAGDFRRFNPDIPGVLQFMSKMNVF